jgi:DNA processing protein
VSEERAYWLAWSRMSGIGPILLKRIWQHFGTLTEAWRAPLSAFYDVEGIGQKLLTTIQAERSRLDPNRLYAETIEKDFKFWTPIDCEYPRLLLEIPSPPPILYYRGEVDLAENFGEKAMVGIVGTRNITDYGRRWTRKLSRTLAQHGFTVVSGMAAGVDTEAHCSCLDGGGRTIAVLGTGIDVVYPRSNLKLCDRIQTQGLIISDYPPGTQPQAQNFPPRNRIIAGLSRAVLIIEAATRSGALITARYANEFNRDVYALPGSLDNPQSLGCLALVNRGAQLILGETHLLEMLGEIPQLDKVTTTPPKPELPPHLASVWDAIATEPTSLDAIVQATGLATGDVLGAILQLEMQDLVTSLPGMRYQKVMR